MKTSEYFIDWLESRKSIVRFSTYEAEKIYFTRHIIPYFENSAPDLSDITPLKIQNYARYKLLGGRRDGFSGGLSLVTVRKHLSLLKHSLNDAVIFGYIPSNPCLPVKLPRVPSVSDRSVFLTSEDAQKLLTSLEGTEIYLAVVLALYYGLRRSEVLGLKWDAIDFRSGTITIKHTVVKNLTIQASDSTKTISSRRTFQLLPEIVPLLLDERKRSNSEYVFCRPDGSVMRPDTLTRTFERFAARAGFPKMRFHDLRHSTASILFDRGWSLEDVKQWLGHSDIETTSNIYLHYGRARQILMAKGISGMFTLKSKNNEKSP